MSFTLICAPQPATLILGGRPGPRTCGGNSAAGFPPFVFCTFSPPATMDQLLRGLATNPVGMTKDADVQAYQTANLVHTPPPPHNCDMVCLHDLCTASSPPNQSFFPFSRHLANPWWWEDLGIAPFHPTIPREVHIPDITHRTWYSTTALQWYRGSCCAPPLPSFRASPASAPNPFTISVPPPLHLTSPFPPSLDTLPTLGGGRIWASPLSIPQSNQMFISPTGGKGL